MHQDIPMLDVDYLHSHTRYLTVEVLASCQFVRTDFPPLVRHNERQIFSQWRQKEHFEVQGTSLSPRWRGCEASGS